MCGIAGFIDTQSKSDKLVLIKMTDTMVHRGPNDSGYELWQQEKVQIGFGHRRLSIIDLTPLGHQPMHYADGRFSIVFNGEIYNYQDIRRELIDLGYSFKSHSDTEVIMAAYQQWQHKAVNRFIGMFSFVLYDRMAQKVHLYRDRAGVKPLYYYSKDGLFLFASELKAFHQHPNFQKKLNMDAVALYFSYGYIPAPHCIFECCQKLLPGHYLIFDLQELTFNIEKYWDVYDFYAKPALKIDEQDAIVETKKLLQSACDYRMVADVPVGVFLSGGYDSSVVASLLQHDRTERIKTFTIGFHEKGFDEAPYAKKVAQYLGTEHTEYYCTAKEALEIIPTLPYFYDEPFADSSSIPTILVSQLAQKQVTVAISADAGDETFAGYNKYDYLYKVHNKTKLLPSFLKKGSAALMDYINPTKLPYFKNLHNFPSRYCKIQHLLQDNSIEEMNISLSSHFIKKDLNVLLKKDVMRVTSFFDIIPPNGQKDLIQGLLAIDYKTYMVDDILAKVDKATMSVSLEGREPLLDHRIIEFVAQLPSNLKYNNGNKKYLLKQITHKHLPKEMMERPKMGFGVPIVEWFQTELREFIEHYCNEKKMEQQGILNTSEIKKIIDLYNQGHPSYFNKLWLILMFQMWHEKWMK